MTDHLHPTKTRLALLAQIDNGQVLTDISADGDVILLFPYAPTQWQDRTTVTAKVREMEAAGWVEEREGGIDWQLTAYGRAIRDVRMLDFGDHVVAECGDSDKPRHLGDAYKYGIGRRWATNVSGLHSVVSTKHQAREELRHMAASLLAAESDGA